MNNFYRSQDVAFIIPTRDRPNKVNNVLESLVTQTVGCGRIIIVASGEDIEHLVLSFSGQLPVEYHKCEPPGQIRQRNLGIRLLDNQTKLVGFLDDDIILKENALENLIEFWNNNSPKTAGIGFNIVNNQFSQPSKIHSIVSKIIPAGRVLRSGVNTGIGNIKKSIQTQWLNGGTTIWKQEILNEFRQKEINTNWAICEDLIFSYPIGKKYPLYVCADAKVFHDHKIDVSINDNIQLERGKKWALWILYFVKSNDNLSIFSYVIMILFTSLMGLLIGVFVPSKRAYVKFYFGRLEGAFTGLMTINKKKNLISLLEDF